jgi:hemerythrin superfamily protein
MATATRERTRESRSYSAGTGAIVGAAVAGAAVGVAATIGRKLFIQFARGATGDWLEALKAEHQAALALFDKLQATDNSQMMIRSHLLSKLKYALGKHANEEENVIYPALREAGDRRDADHLNADHGYVKTYLYELEGMDNDDPAFLARVRDFRSMLEKHMREEENEIFPRLLSRISEEKSDELTALLNKEGFRFA